MDLLKDLRDLFIPKRCLHCKQIIPKHFDYLCSNCNISLEHMNSIGIPNNPVEKILWGKADIEMAASVYFYKKNTPIQSLLKALKYHNHQEVGLKTALLAIEKLKQTKRFKNIDLVTIIPLHPEKEHKRGYNQVELFGQTIATYLKCEFRKDVFVKKYNHKSQTIFNKEERFKGVADMFLINSKYELKNIHILILDDVLTTGATLLSCSNLFKKESKIKTSIITMACVV